MSPTLFVAAGIVIAASVAFVVIGSVYQWDMTSQGYSKWNRIVGAAALLGLVGIAAWTRIDEPLVAAGIMVGGIAIAACYVILYEKLTDRVRGLLNDQR